MICPETQKLCGSKFCLKRGFCENEAFAKIRALVKANPPKPTLDEFERLVLALRQSSYDLGEYVENNASEQLVSETRKIDEQNYAALIGYVKRMGAE